jgi:hypothetical protein
MTKAKTRRADTVRRVRSALQASHTGTPRVTHSLGEVPRFSRAAARCVRSEDMPRRAGEVKTAAAQRVRSASEEPGVASARRVRSEFTPLRGVLARSDSFRMRCLGEIVDFIHAFATPSQKLRLA